MLSQKNMNLCVEPSKSNKCKNWKGNLFSNPPVKPARQAKFSGGLLKPSSDQYLRDLIQKVQKGFVQTIYVRSFDKIFK